MKSAFFRTTLAYLPSVLVPAAANFLFIVVFTRLLGPADLGTYFLMVSVVSFSAVLMGNWFQQSVLRFESGLDAQLMVESFEFHSLFFSTVAGVSVLLFGCYVAARRWAPINVPAIDPLVLPLIVIEVCYRTQLAILQARARAGDYSGAAISLSILRYVVALALFFGAGLRDYHALLLGWLIAQLGIVITLSWRIGHGAALRRVLGRSSEWWTAQRARARQYTTYGLPMLGYMMASEGRPLLDRSLIALLAGQAAVGIFASNYSIGTNVVGLFSMPMLLTAHPVLMALANQKDFHERTFTEANLFLMRMFIIASGMLMIGIAPNSHRIAALAMGARFVEGYSVITLALLGSIIGNFSIYIGKGLELHQKTMYMLGANIASIVLATFFNVFAIRRWGYIGAAYGYVVASTIYLLAVHAIAKRYVRQALPVRLVIIFSLAVTIAWLLGQSAWLDNSLVVGIGTSIVICMMTLAALVSLGELDEEFINFVRSAVTRFTGARLAVSSDD